MKIGVFICHCGLNIASKINVKELVEYARRLGAAYAIDIDYACSEAGQEEIARAITEEKLDAIVVAACSPKLHEATFRRVALRAGLNPYMVSIANIREQCTWVHSGRDAQLKARDLLRMAFERAKHSKPLERKRARIRRSVAVIGGGIAGIEASLILAKAGIKVYLIEKKPTIGGHMALLNEVFPTNDCSICILAPKMNEVWENENIELITNAEVKKIDGRVGNFKLRIVKHPRYVNENCKGCIEDCSSVCPVDVFDGVGIRKAVYIPFPQATPLYAAIDWENCIRCELCVKACKPNAIDFNQKQEEIDINVGSIIIATGFKPFDARRKPEYGYGRIDNVITSLELERLLSASGPTMGELVRKDGKKPEKVAFIQCVGSRDVNTNPYCSRVCCMASIKNALILKERFGTDVTIFYTDMRASGRGYEEYYRMAMKKGVRFVRGIVGQLWENNGKVVVRYEDTLLCRVFEEDFDLVVLAIGMEGTNTFSRGEDGFIEVAHPKLRPAETNTKGIFVAGAASGPKDIQESVASAGLAASKAMQLICSGEEELDPFNAYVTENCIGCRLCAEVCRFNAVVIDERSGKAKIDANACAMCGACVAACPVDAIDMGFFSEEQITAEIDALTVEKNADPLILAFSCWYCGYAAFDLAGTLKLTYPANVRVIRVLCTSRVDPEWIVRAIERGVDGVVVVGCRPGECHFGVNSIAMERIDRINRALELLGEGGRVKGIWCSAGEARKLVAELEDFVERLKQQRGD
ncbi:hydrogenase iron-sulfur subunit [Archaeoglobus veneficus]|uniref:CoB--CoM heterodisulfide reductase iron-sulfur subunit A n=1 Tax=Archaeoglobus veneficus (strain DSM 11195 / SNP6) TaxID=693661 RepID=F2KT56_ARCVS|nr:hydrogenase iron-sulfur subunit [Archaeoglobus veneficus]AEA47086.1 methyl-viologen-reducing hydrogenase delta subunit [Archaeoglobus veneficus SNP6]